MLVLSRLVGEKIIVGEGENRIIIHVVDVRGHGKVRLGIDAPKEVPVHREEVYLSIQQERRNQNGST
jgi:carbon storage regulator